MAIVYIQHKKIQRYFILVFLAVLLLMGFVVWKGFFSGDKTVVSEEKVTTSREETKINFEIFKSPIFQSLQPFSEIQPFQESTTTNEKMGRENPFLPYQLSPTSTSSSR